MIKRYEKKLVHKKSRTFKNIKLTNKAMTGITKDDNSLKSRQTSLSTDYLTSTS